MTTAQYKTICQQPDVMSRAFIEETARLIAFDSPAKVQLDAILEREPIEKPALHDRLNPGSDQFRIDITGESAAFVLDCLLSLEADLVSFDGQTTPQALFISFLVDAWTQYDEFKWNEL